MAIEIGEIRGIISLQDKFSGGINNAAKGLGVFGEAAKTIAGLTAGMAAGLGAATAAVVALGQRGAQVADVKEGFEGLSKAAGASADVMLGALQKGTLGTISNFDLMQAANKAMGSGLVKSSSDMEALAAGAKLLADRTGGDTAEAFDKLTSAMATGKTAALKQLGVFVDSKVAVEDYARSLGKSSGDLTDHEKATALTSAAMASLKQQLQAAGPAAEDFGDFIDQGKVAVQNFTDNLALAVATSPVVMAGMKGIRDAIQAAFGGSQQDTVKMLMGYVNQFAIFLVDAAGVGVKAAQFLTNAFSGAKVIFNAVLEALTIGIGKAADVLATLAEKAQNLPVIGKAFEPWAVALRGTADLANSVALGFGEMKDKALDGAAAQNAAFDKTTAALEKVGGGMRAARDATVEMGTASDTTATSLGKVEEGARLSAEQVKSLGAAMEESNDKLRASAETTQATFEELQERLTLANTTGLEQRLLEIELARQRELDGLITKMNTESALYEQARSMIETIYAKQTAAAQLSYLDQAAAAVGSFLTQQQAAQQAYDLAKTNYEKLAADAKSTFMQVALAHEQVEDKKQKLEAINAKASLERFGEIAAAASSILRDIFGKNKVAAIAAALIDTSAAIVKSLASLPMPWALVPAAAAAAAGYAQVQRIRNTNLEGFARGTLGMAFEDFGRGSLEMLHGQEAVVTRAQGASLAEMVGDAIREARGAGGGNAGQLVPVHVELKLDGTTLGQAIYRLSLSKRVRIHEGALVKGSV